MGFNTLVKWRIREVRKRGITSVRRMMAQAPALALVLGPIAIDAVYWFVVSLADWLVRGTGSFGIAIAGVAVFTGIVLRSLGAGDLAAWTQALPLRRGIHRLATVVGILAWLLVPLVTLIAIGMVCNSNSQALLRACAIAWILMGVVVPFAVDAPRRWPWALLVATGMAIGRWETLAGAAALTLVLLMFPAPPHSFSGSGSWRRWPMPLPILVNQVQYDLATIGVLRLIVLLGLSRAAWIGVDHCDASYHVAFFVTQVALSTMMAAGTMHALASWRKDGGAWLEALPIATWRWTGLAMILPGALIMFTALPLFLRLMPIYSAAMALVIPLCGMTVLIHLYFTRLYDNAPILMWIGWALLLTSMARWVPWLSS